MSDTVKTLTRDAQGKLTLQKKNRPALLVIEDGTVLTGVAFGKTGTATGELVFNTSLSGYQEVLTDPSYAGQVITFTYPEIGNYGVTADHSEGRVVRARGVVVRHLSRLYSNQSADESLHSFLEKEGIVGIAEIDTRAVTRSIRDGGAMRCLVTSDHEDNAENRRMLLEKVRNLPDMNGQDLTAEVTTRKIYKFGDGKRRVAVLDFGCKQNILRELVKRDIEATVYPADTSADIILESRPDGIFLSNGPGDPAACTYILSQLPKLIESRIPIFGICLGHQLLSLALGARTFKLKFGHRGGNQPVKDLTTGKIEITSQNHGFAVDERTIPEHLELTHVNLNDMSVEGVKHKTLPIFAVQYHPESSPGPHDSTYLFDRFVTLMQSQSQRSDTKDLNCTN